MKKKLLIVLFCFIVVCSICLLTGCSTKKNSISSEEFKSKMEEKGYTLIEATDQFPTAEYLKKVYLACDVENQSINYQIEFYEFSDDDNAVKFFNQNKAIFEESKSSSSIETSTSIGNNAKYTLTANSKYKVLSRINNTVIFVDVDSKYKDTVNDVLKELGY